jgi:hypothetical protein
MQRVVALTNNKTAPVTDPEAIRQQLRRDIFLGVTLHEVGHNMGLRHNFRASFDAMNYHPEYWQLRTAGVNDTQRFAGYDPQSHQVIGVPYQGTDCNDKGKAGTVRPRYVDCPGGATSVSEVVGTSKSPAAGPGTGASATRQGGVREFQYSSIMDYGAEFNSDLMGLGMYDRAAMKYSYAGDGYVEVFNAPLAGNALDRINALVTFQGAFGFPSALIQSGNTLGSVNYTTFPDLFTTGWKGIYDRVDVPRQDVECSLESDSVPVGTPGHCLDATSGNPELNSKGNMKDGLTDPNGKAMVPYFFCSDEFVGNLTCARFDSGADAFEQAQDIISRYENFYLLNNFKRDRYTFHTSGAYLDRIYGRYFEILRNQLTWYALLRSDFTDPVYGDPSQTYDFFSEEGGWGNFTVAVTEGFDLLGRVISMPSAGQYMSVDAGSSPDYPFNYFKQINDNAQDFASGPFLPVLEGKFTSTTWAFTDCGYYWADECQSRIGYFFDKVVALQTLADSQAYFTGRDTSTDVRKYAIGYFLPFKSQIQEKLGALLAGDYASLAPRIDMNDPSGTPSVIHQSWTLNKAPTNMSTTDQLVDPSTGFSIQLYTGVYGLSGFPDTFDQSFIDTTKVFVVGNGEAPVSDAEITAKGTSDPTQTLGAGGTKEWFLWRDSSSGKTFAAHSSAQAASGDPNTHSSTDLYRNDTAVRMLTMASMLDAAKASACAGANAASQTCAAKTTALAQFTQNLDVMRALHNHFGYGRYITDF